MAKKKKHEEEHENLERWLVSYADFITLLFATFVTLYALSQIDLAKFKALKVSLKQAFSHSSILKGGDGILNKKGQNMLDAGGFNDTKNVIPPILSAAAAKEEEKQYELIQEELKLRKIDELKGIKTKVTARGLVIKMMGNVFFESSTSELKKESLETLKQVGMLVKEKFPFNIIRVEGHTDNHPINSAQFPSNWELSAYRAAGVVRYLNKNVGINKNRLITVGYSDSRPIASNETEKGRKANRRVEIVILKSKLTDSEIKTYEFQKERLEKLKEIKELQNKKSEEENVSEAVKKLIKNSGNSYDKVIIYSDEDIKEIRSIKEDLEKYEKSTDSAARNKLFLYNRQPELKNKIEIKTTEEK